MFLEISGSSGADTFEQKRVSVSELVQIIESHGVELPAAIKRQDDGYQFNYVNLGEKDRHGQFRAPQGVKMSATTTISYGSLNLTINFFRTKTVRNGETIYAPHKLSYSGANPWFTREQHAEALFLYLSGNCEKSWMKSDAPIWRIFDGKQEAENARKWALTVQAFVKGIYDMPEQELRIRAAGINVGGRMVDSKADPVLIAKDVVDLVMNPRGGYDPAEVVRQFNHTESNWLGVVRQAMVSGAFRMSADGYWQWASGELEGTNIIKIPVGQDGPTALIQWATNPLNKDILLGQLQRLGYILPSQEIAAKKQAKTEQEVALNKLIADGALYFHAKTKSVRDSDDNTVLTVTDPTKWLNELLKDYKASPDKYAAINHVP